MKHIFLFLITILLTQNTFGESMSDDKKKVANSAEEICPIKVGEEIPYVNVKNLEGENLNLNNYVKGRRTVLVFYRGGWCPYCNLQLADLNEIENELIALGYQMIAISMDKPEKLIESLGEHQLSYTLLSDSKAEASIAFGLAFKVADDYNKMLLSHNMNLEEASGENHHILPVPAVFIVDENSIIQFEYVNPDYKVRLNGEILLKAAEQYSLKVIKK